MIDTTQLMWFSLCFLFLFLEMGHPGLFYFLAFSFGAFCSYFTTFYTNDISSQVAIFLGATSVALYTVYVCVNKQENQLASPSHRSNNDALIGQKVIIYQSPQDEQIWLTKIYGQVWVVKNIGNDAFVAGQHVVIRDVQGCHLRVAQINIPS